jgi:hypothetical protein
MQSIGDKTQKKWKQKEGKGRAGEKNKHLEKWQEGERAKEERPRKSPATGPQRKIRSGE